MNRCLHRGLSKRRQGGSSALLLLVALTLAACGDGASSTPAPPGEVVATESTFVDGSRFTAANGTFPSGSERTLHTRLWYLDRAPRENDACRRGACGLVVLAHGFGGFTGRFDRLARGLADAGWIVAAPTFPLTNQFAPGGIALGDFANQPADLSYVIDQLLAASASDDGALADRIDPEFIALVGHSLGGATVVAATRSPGLKDERVTAVVGVAPAVAVIEPLLREPASAEGPPMLIVQGTEDLAISYASSRQYYDSIDAPRAFVGLTGADHVDLIEFDPYPGTFIPETQAATLAFLAAIRSGDPSDLERTLDDLAAAGHATELDLGR